MKTIKPRELFFCVQVTGKSSLNFPLLPVVSDHWEVNPHELSKQNISTSIQHIQIKSMQLQRSSLILKNHKIHYYKCILEKYLTFRTDFTYLFSIIIKQG